MKDRKVKITVMLDAQAREDWVYLRSVKVMASQIFRNAGQKALREKAIEMQKPEDFKYPF